MDHIAERKIQTSYLDVFFQTNGEREEDNNVKENFE